MSYEIILFPFLSLCLYPAISYINDVKWFFWLGKLDPFKIGKNLLLPSRLIFLKKRRIIMPTTGEKPGKGTYKCKNCGQIVRLDDNSDTLPPCPSCNGTEFEKVY